LVGIVLLFTRKQANWVFITLLVAFITIVFIQYIQGVYRSNLPKQIDFIWNTFVTSPLIIEFIVGFLLSESIFKKPKQSILAWSLFTISMLFVSIWVQKYGGLIGVGMAAFLYYPERVIFFGSTALGLVALAALVPSPKNIFGDYLCLLGDASYGLYLLHIPTLVILYGLLFPKINGLLWFGGGKLSLAVYLAATVGFSIIYFKLIEYPLHRISRKISEAIFSSEKSQSVVTTRNQ